MLGSGWVAAMADPLRCRLARHLEYLTPEELKNFKLYLVGSLPRGCLEEADRTKIADLLVCSHGQQGAWELALSIWKKMDLRELWELARKEDLGFVSAPVLSGSSDKKIKYQEQMKKKFKLMKDRNSRPGEHELFHHRFTQLLLLQGYRHKEQKQHELLVHGWKHAELMQKQGQLIEVAALFDPDQETGTQPDTVVLQGAAGIGKTILVIKVILDWVEGKLYQKRFDYVFYLSCRELNPLGEKVISFADLIGNDWPGPQAPMAEIMYQPEKLLFIIDGLDELKFPCNEPRYDLCKDWKQQRPVSILLSSLLRKTLLPEACLLLTTRLTALEKFSPLLENPRHVEILGFSVEQRKEYFCKFFRNEDLGEKVFSLVRENATLFTMCSVPLMTWIVCTCLKQQEERGQDPIQALKTTTAVYICYINLIIPNDKSFISHHLRGLCCLAAEGIWERKLLFEEEDLRRHNLEAADVSAFLDMNIFQKDIFCETCYSFIHLSFQEFFAAMFYLMSTDEQGEKRPDSSIPDINKLLEENSGHDTSFVVLVVHFLFGFLNVETAKELERKFRCRMSLEIKSQLLQWIKEDIERDYKFVFPKWYSLLFETQDAGFVTQALVNIQEIKVAIADQYDALNAAFCIKYCPGVWRIIFCCVSSLPAYFWQGLFSVVSKNQKLKELKLYHHTQDDFCSENLCVELRHPNCKLETLTLERSKLNYLCCQCLLSAPSLKSLYLKYVSFEIDNQKLPWETLGKKKSNLQTLSIYDSGRYKVCFVEILSGFLNNGSLKNLHLQSIFLDEISVTFLCNFLAKQDCKLETLSLVFSTLSFMSYPQFISALRRNESLKNLDVSGNFLENEKINLLCKALGKQNSKLEKLRFCSCYLTDDCLPDLLPFICSNENLKSLDLSFNFFTDEGMKLLCETLEKQDCKLQTLHFKQYSLSEESKKALTNLKSRKTLLAIIEDDDNVTPLWDWTKKIYPSPDSSHLLDSTLLGDFEDRSPLLYEH